LLVHGEADSAIAPRYATEAAALVRNGRAMLLPGLGHLAHEEKPADVAAIIREAAT
jgi:magnesium chelatase accessory protein